ncbi:hypothetical protein Desti_3207 [Desulfomonile tiedjei DSM 6799]|uniref:Uncharacterized protein n=1 Tax=Desulfomonile tiedjei (strain ATCC 49306 / DSM 6799 / DCB-1) TaxID=706587 RepID=I4C8H7_DESTA|nr:hypothetical protein Desti_3207 [Desulfomonile tiedjei DSM 6799]
MIDSGKVKETQYKVYSFACRKSSIAGMASRTVILVTHLGQSLNELHDMLQVFRTNPLHSYSLMRGVSLWPDSDASNARVLPTTSVSDRSPCHAMRSWFLRVDRENQECYLLKKHNMN